MEEDPRAEITRIVRSAVGADANGEPSAELFVRLYDELHRLARGYMAGERRSHTLQTTALVHEAFLRLVDQREIGRRGRAYFLGACARAMRRVLVDHARAKGRGKRGAGWRRVTLGGDEPGVEELDVERYLALDAALEELAELDPRQARTVELRFYAGLTVAEVAAALEVSKRTVEADWTHARAWLGRRLGTAPR